MKAGGTKWQRKVSWGTEMGCSTKGITERGTFTRENTKKGIKDIILVVGGKHIKGG